ncbi:MAG TPA: dTDP-4-dehydrorhamnose reductase [Rhodanobacteraceae bacterium]|nr:dTDP-4-dehydrorhamnose reductase [Rhodanobacteraceae bacterium]
MPTPALPLKGREKSTASRQVIPATRDGALEDGTACERLDLADIDGLGEALDRIDPQLIVNAAAYTAVDRAEDEPELAMRINADAVGTIGEWAARHASCVVHYSTDYVFDGTATRPYREDDATNPLGTYGRSKLAGERAFRESGARHLILRTAWVYGARGQNFLRTMLRLAAERDELRVVADQFGAPTSAGLIADVTARAITRWLGSDDETGGRAMDGTYHLVAGGQTSWCGFARAIFERATRVGLLKPAPRVEAIRTADYPTRAKRPAYSVLDTSRLRDTFQVGLPDWHGALNEVIDELAKTDS